jgi:hypothetical protein
MMSARRCAHCDANWINTPTNEDCPACGKRTWLVNDPVDKTFDDARKAREERAAWTTTTDGVPDEEVVLPTDYLHDHRVERFVALGFSELSAERLATARDALGFPLYHGDIATALQAGCTHEQAVGIYA